MQDCSTNERNPNQTITIWPKNWYVTKTSEWIAHNICVMLQIYKVTNRPIPNQYQTHLKHGYPDKGHLCYDLHRRAAKRSEKCGSINSSKAETGWITSEPITTTL